MLMLGRRNLGILTENLDLKKRISRMNQLNQESTDIPTKRKRGRPRKDEILNQQEKPAIAPKPESIITNDTDGDDMMGQLVSGVVEGSFDAGYFLNVKIKDTEKELRGVVFIPDKVAPITAANDVVPHVKMYEREDISIPSLYEQTQPQDPMDNEKQTESSRTQLATCIPANPNDQPMKELGIASELPSSTIASCMNLSEPRNQALSLMPQADTVGPHEGSHKPDRDATRFVDFFPTPDTVQPQAMGSSSNPTPGAEPQKSPAYEEPRGFDLMTGKPHSSMENVPEELQLELGNKTMSGANPLNTGGGLGENVDRTTTETIPQTVMPKSGFLANLFKGEGTATEIEASALESGFPVAHRAEDSSNKNLDSNMEEANLQIQ